MICLNPKAIIQARNKKNMTQQDLADEAGLSRKMIVKMESGRVKNPYFCNIVSICKVLRLSLDSLIDSDKPLCCD